MAQTQLESLLTQILAQLVANGSATIAPGDIEIGAIEVKNGTDDTRAKVGVATAAAESDNALSVKDPSLGVTTGAAVITDAAGTVQQYLRGLVKQWIAGTLVLGASSNIVGKVGFDQSTIGTTDSVTVKGQGAIYAATITRPANQTAYSANDVLGGALTLTGGPSGAGEFIVTSAELEADIASLPAGMTNFNLYLYNVTPPSAVADNGAFDLPSGDRASFLGKIALGTLVDEGSTLYLRNDGVGAQITIPSGGSIFGYLVTAAGFTPAANSEVYKLKLHGATV